ncbi:MAG: VanZ family protein [Acidobacteria bacterium]|nr:VanZ family protein [Acidobacteriota bacterium]MBV9478072.1 VanZ family protein [Acidobacteriota bacterium]
MRFLRYWLPVIVWAACLVSAGNDRLSSSHTHGWLHEFIGQFLSDRSIELVNILIRKATHLTAYGFLGALGFRAARAERRGFTMRWAGIALAIVLVVASIDEIHQSMTRMRTGRPQDVLLDLCGAAIALVVIRFSASRREA